MYFDIVMAVLTVCAAFFMFFAWMTFVFRALIGFFLWVTSPHGGRRDFFSFVIGGSVYLGGMFSALMIGVTGAAAFIVMSFQALGLLPAGALA